MSCFPVGSYGGYGEREGRGAGGEAGGGAGGAAEPLHEGRHALQHQPAQIQVHTGRPKVFLIELPARNKTVIKTLLNIQGIFFFLFSCVATLLTTHSLTD